MTHSVFDAVPTRWELHKHWAQSVCFVALMLLTVSRVLTAQDSGVRELGHFELAPLFSYRTGMSFGIEAQAQQTNPRLLLDGNPGYGVAVGLHIREGDAIEFRWNRHDSYTHIQDAGTAFPRTRVILDQFHCDISHEYFLRGRAQNVRPFIIGSVGGTTISSGANPGSTYLSLGVGGGLKFLVGKHLGFRLQTQWLPIFIDPQQAALCGSGCGARVGGTLGSQFEVAAGPVLRF